MVDEHTSLVELAAIVSEALEPIGFVHTGLPRLSGHLISEIEAPGRSG